jgi:hypothetical protein
MKQIREMDYVKSHRRGDTGIGKTLEDLLGIKENNISGPDFSTYELKAARRESVSMLTLFTKAPSPKGANRSLLRAFGYQERKGRTIRQREQPIVAEPDVPLARKELHVTVDSLKRNSVGLQLKTQEDRIHISNEKGVDAYYSREVLREAFESKYHSLAYVLADSKKEHGNEYFWFNEVRLLTGFSFDRFSQLVESGDLKLDLRLGHYPDGQPHDHGTGFRILPKHLPECFEKIERVL